VSARRLARALIARRAADNRRVNIIWTVGHSTHPIETFLRILARAGITSVADVRRFPASRKHPHFNQQALAEALAGAGMAYHGFPELGGRRTPRPGSPNTAWRVAGFQGYADYMESPAFKAGVERLLVVARAAPTAIMCAEALWTRCHRGLIADYLKALGLTVIHLRDGASEEHPYTGAARLVEGRLSYRAEGGAAECVNAETHD
jgi:uncharacterized protein (DUF488 family)